MNRQQYIENAKKLRKGKITATIGTDEHGRRFVARIEDHASLNIAKKKNGRGAVALTKHEHFPPMKEALPKVEEPEAVAA